MLPLYALAALLISVASAEFTQEQKAGRLLMPTIDAAYIEKHAADIRDGTLRAGMLAWDKHSDEELRALRVRLDLLTGSGDRFLLAVDHEGGPLFTQRSAGLTIFPGNMALGATGDEVLALEAARGSAFELTNLGIDMVFSPVADVNSDPLNPIISIRAFGDDPKDVSRFTKAAVRGYEAGGVIPVVKHFPGHGDTDTDSHSGLPSIKKSSTAIHSVDLPPFKAAVNEGVQAVMTAHILIPALGAGKKPATLSSRVLQGVLREKMGFSGVIVSDSLEMSAITKNRTVAEASVEAVRAGCDLLLTGRAPLKEIRKRIAAEIDASRIDASLVRIAALEKRPSDFSRKKLRSPDWAARVIADSSVTLLRDRKKLLPLKGRGNGLLFVVHRSMRFKKEAKSLGNAVKKQFPEADTVFVSPKPSASAVKEAMRKARLASQIVVFSYHWGRKPFPSQKRFISRLLQLNKPAVLVSGMSPYDIPSYPDAGTVVIAYGFTEVSLGASVRLLAGVIQPSGHLPVSLGERIPRGQGLDAFRR